MLMKFRAMPTMKFRLKVELISWNEGRKKLWILRPLGCRKHCRQFFKHRQQRFYTRSNNRISVIQKNKIFERYYLEKVIFLLSGIWDLRDHWLVFSRASAVAKCFSWKFSPSDLKQLVRSFNPGTVENVSLPVSKIPSTLYLSRCHFFVLAFEGDNFSRNVSRHLQIYHPVT